MDRSKYSPDWQDIIRPSILKRDNYVCAVCGVRHKSRVYKMAKGGYKVLDEFTEEWAKANGKSVFTLYLVVAHLDQNTYNNDPKNLLTLCPSHHARYDAKSKSLKRKIKYSMQDLKHSSMLPGELKNQSDHLGEIQKLVRELTAVSITKNEAETIFSLTLNFLQNVRN